MATSIIEAGFLRLELDISTIGPMSAKEAGVLRSDLIKFFKDKSYNVSGKLKFININTLEIDRNHAKPDTGISSTPISSEDTSSSS